MPVTVVINRDYDGVATCREVYATGSRYSIGDSNLQIFSAESTLLALYGSGNWLSVEIDGAEPGPAAVAAAAAAAAVAAAEAEADAAPPRPRHVSDPVVPVLDDDDLPADLASAGVAAASPGVDVPSTPPRDPGWGLSERLAAQSSSLRPVVFRPRTYRAARPGAEPPRPTTWGPASQLRPVVFRPKTYRAARDETAPEAQPEDAAGDD